MMARCIALACMLSACRYDSTVGIARQLDAGADASIDAPPPTWRIATVINGAAPRAMHGTSEVDAWIVGRGGEIWRWNGVTLADVAGPLADVDLDAVWAASPSLAYAVGARADAPATLQWDGAQWSAITTPADGALTGVTGITDAGGARVWSAGHAANFLSRASTSTPWERHAGPELVTSPEDVWAAGDDVWVAGDQGIARFRASDGAFVERFDSVALWGVHGRAPDDVWAVGEQGTIRHWNGAAWSATPSGVTVTLRDVWASAPDRAWAVGDAGTVLRWDGLAWTTDADFAPWNLSGLWGTDASNVFAVGSTTTAGVVVRLTTTEIGL